MSSSKRIGHTAADCDVCDTKSKGFLCSTSSEVSEHITKVKADCFYRAGSVIFRAGDQPVGLFSVRKGVVKIESLSVDGRAHTLSLVGAGSVLGYRSFFNENPYAKSAIAIEDTDICFIPKAEVSKLFASYSELGLKLISQLGSDLEQAQHKWVDQIDKGTPARVADALLFLNEKFSGSSWTRKEIAEWAGTTPETVIRTLAQFEKEGLISQNYRNFSILSREKLVDRANS